MLSAYRELSDIQSIELDTHLETCAACRQVLAQQGMVNEQLHLLPTLSPDTDAHTKLMRVLAAEHAAYLQRMSASTTSAKPVPDFLKPYIKEHVRETATTVAASRRAKRATSGAGTLAAFSTAETGPLPILTKRQRQRPSSFNQFAILGLAAVFLLTLLTGGLVSLLVLANNSISGAGTRLSTSVTQQSQVSPASFQTQTAYRNVTSAVASGSHIYYSAYNDGQQQWMIEQTNGPQKDTTTAISTPLLSKASTNPLYVLSASASWLVWLQLNTPQAVYERTSQSQSKHVTIENFTRDWDIYALSVTSKNSTPLLLTSGVFNTSTAPTWVHSPVQGLSLTSTGTLLVALVDAQGNSQLVSYLLNGQSKISSSVLATANSGHILTSPTMESTGAYTFWSEEWLTSDNMLHGNIWERQENKALTYKRTGQSSKYTWQPTITTSTSLFRSDETSFRPQVVNDTLFLLSTDATNITNGQGMTAQGTPDATVTVQATPTGTPNTVPPTFPVAPRLAAVNYQGQADATKYQEQVDATITGTLFAYSLTNLDAQPKVMGNGIPAVAPQGGTNYLIWQTSAGYQMYDTDVHQSVSVTTLPHNASFLAVNGDATVWMVLPNSSTGTNGSNGASNGSTTAPITFSWFNWPGNS
jgi:hypothetical protein